LDFERRNQNAKLWKRKRTIEKAKIRNCDSEEAKSKSFLHFAFQPFQVFGSRLFASFLCIFASRRVAEWSRRWTLKPRCRHRCGFDLHVCQGFKAPSLAQGFADFPDWNIGLPPTRLVTLREPHICKTVVHFAVGKLAFKLTIPSHSRCEFDLRLS
jgi:hypothetical protein